ncbi:uncharacterized protein LOC111268588 [Varroa jacobsoni]|uniref:uncharacterized protein LOC111268588 n=1 Tax=Varroa jacobsoni TaxID=62625 RepID=UPI000BF8DF1A|nr:uncharacterized protein LOC111268588 [Varroa jacobsoni]
MASVLSLSTVTSRSGSLTSPIQLALILLLVLPTGDAGTETRFAASFKRRNRTLQGCVPLWSAELPSVSQCLSACIRLGCQSLVYGHGRCELFPTFLCHPKDRFHLSLVPAAGMTYFDLGSEITHVKTLWSDNGCLLYDRCLKGCNEDSWTTLTSATTTTVGLAAIGENSAISAVVGTALISAGNSKSKATSVQSTDPISLASLPSEPTTKAKKIGARFFLTTEPMTFRDSSEYCRRRNMSLGMPKTREEHNILVEAMKIRQIGRMWIGVKKITEGGTDATYIDGRSVPTSMQLWGDGQPNNSRGKQICIEMMASLKYLWNDFDCLYKSAFVCR